MTPEEQRIALCEWMGWKYHKPTPEEIESGSYYQYEPDTNSLDVLHEMEQKLTPNQWDKYADLICNYCVADHDPDIRMLITLTAAERRMFMLKALGLWKEAK